MEREAEKIIKSVKIAVVIFFLLAVFLLLARLFVGGGEDTWMCIDGEWVRHGVPSAPMPETECK